MATFSAYQLFTMDYKLVGMARNSCKFRHYGNGQLVYVHRNLINKHEDWKDFEVGEIIMPNGEKQNWLKVTYSSFF